VSAGLSTDFYQKSGNSRKIPKKGLILTNLWQNKQK